MTFWANKALERKDDGAVAYASNRNVLLYFGHKHIQTEVVALKAFLESFSLSYSPKFDEASSAEAQVEAEMLNTTFKYSVVLSVPAFSWEEAQNNDKQYYILENFVRRHYRDAANKMTKEGNVHRVLLNNLIYNGYHDAIPQEISSYSTLADYAVQGFVSEISRDIDVDMGFFEDQWGRPIPKAFKITFELSLWDKFENGAGTTCYTFKPFVPNTKQTGIAWRTQKWLSQSERDTRNWPFGFNLGRHRHRDPEKSGIPGTMGMDPAVRDYIKNKPHTKFRIGYAWYDIKTIDDIWFPCFLESLQQKWGSEVDESYSSGASNEVQIMKTTWKNRQISFHVPFYSDREGWANMEKIAVLFRYLLLAGGPERPSNELYIRFGNFIKGIGSFANGSARCLPRSVSVDFDLSMGFHETADNFLVPKAIKLSFNLDLLSDDPDDL